MITETDRIKFETTFEYLKQVPYDISKDRLYTAQELYSGYNPDCADSFRTCFDTLVYNHYISTGKIDAIEAESLARTLHDHSIHTALKEFFKSYNKQHCVGIMGGHALQRTDYMYKKIVLLSKRLTELGFFMLSGGGPGAMEATPLGAWMAGYSNDDVEEALQILSVAPSFKNSEWLASAFKVINKYPQNKYISLGIPTWLYGHEPSTPFATHIAKFFENSIREDSILTLAFGGIIYTPGSAGTMQEIFQDAVQNHYLSFGISSPMIFMGKEAWTQHMPVYPLLKELQACNKYKNLLLALSDDIDEIIDKLIKFRNHIEKIG